MGIDPELDLMAKRLRMARASLGLKQAEVAERAGISQSVLSLYEHGRRDPLATTIKRLCSLYGVSADWVMGIEGAQMRRA